MKILDVSLYQGDIDWEKAKKDGVEGVVIRAGFGKGNLDEKFHKNAENAIKNGLLVGVYWFSYAYTVQMARNEATFCHAVIGKYKNDLKLPVFFDWEYDSMRWAKKNGVNPDKNLISEMISAWCERMEDFGYDAGYYLNQDYARNYVDETRLKAYKRWFAKYTVTEQKDCFLWQYTSKGKVDGVSGNVDVNQLWGTVVSLPDPAEAGEKDEGSEYNMPIIRKGSTGKAVKIWQIIVGVDPDGIFGQKTLAATHLFQKRYGLVVDGVVGPKTWKAGLDHVQ